MVWYNFVVSFLMLFELIFLYKVHLSCTTLRSVAGFERSCLYRNAFRSVLWWWWWWWWRLLMQTYRQWSEVRSSKHRFVIHEFQLLCHRCQSLALSITVITIYVKPLTTVWLIIIHSTTALTCWRFGVAVTRWSRSTQLLYIEPG